MHVFEGSLAFASVANEEKGKGKIDLPSAVEDEYVLNHPSF